MSHLRSVVVDFEALFRPPEPPNLDAEPVIRPLMVGDGSCPAWLVDNLIEAAAIKPLHEWFLTLGYRFGDVDRADTSFMRHLVHYFDEEECEGNTPVATIVTTARSVVQSLGLNADQLERVYANFNLFGDQQFSHTDGDCWTALMFVNSSWSVDWGGELLLYEQGPGSVALAIPPRPGRMVVFDGNLEHRGGSPNRFCLDARITVATKFVRPTGSDARP